MLAWPRGCLALAMLSVLATAADAQKRPYRRHFWLEFGGGTGTTRIACSTCKDLTITYGPSSYTRMGGSLSDRVLLGFEGFTLLDKRVIVPGVDTVVTTEGELVGAIVIWYPFASGVFFKGGLGIGAGSFTVRPPDPPPGAPPPVHVVAEGFGSGVTFGVGLDLPVFKWLSITANVGTYFIAIGDITVQGTVFEDLIGTMYNANFAFTIR